MTDSIRIRRILAAFTMSDDLKRALPYAARFAKTGRRPKNRRGLVADIAAIALASSDDASFAPYISELLNFFADDIRATQPESANA